ncbi:MAG: hypothetical protein CFK52_00980, partial [Chloracidobacterium sp. CP2_5A]
MPLAYADAYANALKGYLSNRTDLQAVSASVAPVLTEAGVQNAAQLAALHHEALAALFKAGELTPDALAGAGDFLAALQLDQRWAPEQAARLQTWRALLDQLPIPIWLLDAESSAICYGNQAALQLYGYAADEWIGLDARKLAADDALEAWQAYLADRPCRRAEPMGFTKPMVWRHQAKDGAPIVVHL